MKKIKTYITIVVVMFVIQIQAQTVKEILEKTKNSFEEKQQYKIKADYTLYRGVTSMQKLTGYSGELIFNKPIFYNRIDKTETIASDKYFFKVNHNEKVIIYTKDKRIINQNKELDLSYLLKAFDTGKLTEEKGNWICELIPKKYSPLPYRNIKLVINKKTLELKKQIMLLKRTQNFSTTNKEEYDYMRLEIKFHKIEKLTKEDFTKIDVKRFVTVKGNKAELTEKYKKYQVIDNN